MSAINTLGHLRKMQTTLADTVEYKLPVGDELIAINSLLGQTIKLSYTAQINCIHCGRKSNKSFNQGYCYPCFKKLAQCDTCIVSPEKCHYFEGTCREPEWGDEFCMKDHYVYLANSSGVKVGITRGTQIPTRWMDQGAIQALPIFRVSNRLQSGAVEMVYKKHIADKTNWRTMLKGEVDVIDLLAERDRLFSQCSDEISSLQEKFGLQAVQPINDADSVTINYPVLEYPTKITSMNFDKQADIEGALMGIKGQYLIMDIGVINIRKFAGYHINFSA